MTTTTKPCPQCEGLGRVADDPAVSQAELLAEVRDRVSTPRPEFAARIEQARKAREASRQ